jgi:hypothetical protein
MCSEKDDGVALGHASGKLINEHLQLGAIRYLGNDLGLAVGVVIYEFLSR